MEQPTNSSLRLLAMVVDRLRPAGWEVRQGYCGGNHFNVELRHPLTSGYGLGFPNDDADHTAFVERSLSQREFRVIAERPPELVHESLLGRLRTAAQANRWDADVLAIVARVLRHEDVLTDAEAAWLERAGPAWSETDAREF